MIFWPQLSGSECPQLAHTVAKKDREGLPSQDVGPERAVVEAIAWLGRAHDHSRSRDGGVARHFSLIDGWGTSYPETTGYIIPTLLDYARWRGGDEAMQARTRARRMLDWLVSIQYSDGGFQGGTIDADLKRPVTFNTGQILLGLAAGVQEFGEEFRRPMGKAADWLVASQDRDGCWRKHPTPYARAGEKTYETHVAWGLLQAARVDNKTEYADAALANVRWALRHQRDNGWFDKCCLEETSKPFTHTLGYVLRGLVEAYRYSQDEKILEAARKTADGLLTALREEGRLPGQLMADWAPACRWVCLTGSVQVGHCWLQLFRDTGDTKYRDAGLAVNRYVRRTIDVDGPLEVRGGVKGSFPVDGDYGRFQYLSWAAKFLIDSNLLELR